MKDDIEALTELTLAIACAAAEKNPTFEVTLGTLVRQKLQSYTARPGVFRKKLSWLERFEASLAKNDGFDHASNPGEGSFHWK